MYQLQPIFGDATAAIDPAGDGVLVDLDALAKGGSLQQLINLTRRLFDNKAAFLTIMGRQFQWFLAADGLTPVATPREHSVCQSVVFDRGLTTVFDLRMDGAFGNNPFVHGAEGLRAYAGIRLSIDQPRGGAPIEAAFCIADDQPHEFTTDDLARLADLAVIAEAIVSGNLIESAYARLSLDHAKLVHVANRKERLFRQTERMVAMGSWRLDLDSRAMEWSPGVYAIHALRPGAPPPVPTATTFYMEEGAALLGEAMERCQQFGEPFDHEYDFRAADGVFKRVRSTGECELADGRPVALVGMFQDISARHQLETLLRNQAMTDPLTGLGNRAALQRQLGEAFRAMAYPDKLALLLIDLDAFKALNDRLGHIAGDEALVMFAAMVSAVASDVGFVARYGGDEFVVLITGDQARDRGEKLLAALNDRIAAIGPAGSNEIKVSATIGVAAFHPGDTALDLLRRADDAMYRKKPDKRRFAG